METMTLKQARLCCKHDSSFRIRYAFCKSPWEEFWNIFEWSLERKPELARDWSTVCGNGSRPGLTVRKEGIWPKDRV